MSVTEGCSVSPLVGAYPDVSKKQRSREEPMFG